MRQSLEGGSRETAAFLVQFIFYCECIRTCISIANNFRLILLLFSLQSITTFNVSGFLNLLSVHKIFTFSESLYGNMQLRESNFVNLIFITCATGTVVPPTAMVSTQLCVF